MRGRGGGCGGGGAQPQRRAARLGAHQDEAKGVDGAHGGGEQPVVPGTVLLVVQAVQRVPYDAGVQRVRQVPRGVGVVPVGVAQVRGGLALHVDVGETGLVDGHVHRLGDLPYLYQRAHACAFRWKRVSRSGCEDERAAGGGEGKMDDARERKAAAPKCERAGERGREGAARARERGGKTRRRRRGRPWRCRCPAGTGR